MSTLVLAPEPVASSRPAKRPFRVVRGLPAMARLAARWDRPVVLVPTMGALHEGHLSLVKRARRLAGRDGLVIVSIFVNPTQFAPHEDLSKYPRPLRRDLELCRRRGVDLVFHPDAASMYAPDASVGVDETLLSAGLCGAARPGHFRGVCTVVAKLFNLIRPSAAVFGRKDYQQLAIVRRLARDLNFPVRIVGAEIVREPDGLALSSRNVYLTPAQRAQAPALRRALLQAAAQARAGEHTAARLRALLTRALAQDAPLARVDYFELVGQEALQATPRWLGEPALLAAAIFFGQTRLIDNIELPPLSRSARTV